MIGGQNQVAIRSNPAKPGNIVGPQGPQGEPGENPLEDIPTYENNEQAILFNEPLGRIYKTSTGELRIVV